MSIQPTTGSTSGLPIVNQALEPAWVRHGSASTQKAYDSALSFEQTLVEQLSQSLASAGGLSGESSEGESGSEEGGSSGGANGELASLIPQALTNSVMHAGGLGLAAQMTHQLEGVASSKQAHATGGTAPIADSVAKTDGKPSTGTGTGTGTGTSPAHIETITGGTAA
jgi:hypothetical protein